jgi:hypothetical protein
MLAQLVTEPPYPDIAVLATVADKDIRHLFPFASGRYGYRSISNFSGSEYDSLRSCPLTHDPGRADERLGSSSACFGRRHRDLR